MKIMREPSSKLERELAIIYCRLNSFLRPLTAAPMSGEERNWLNAILGYDAIRGICPEDASAWVHNKEDEVWRGTKILNAYSVAQPLKGSIVDGFTFTFGVDKERVAAQLRLLADAIESGQKMVLIDQYREPRVTVERITFESTAQADDFTTSRVTMILTEKVPAP